MSQVPEVLISRNLERRQSGLAYADAKKQGAVLGWGQFLTVALNFLIIAGVLFLAIKAINKLKKEEPPAPAPEPTAEVKLLTEIRDLLKKVGVMRHKVRPLVGLIAIQSSSRRSALRLPLPPLWWHALRHLDGSAERRACRASSGLTGR